MNCPKCNNKMNQGIYICTANDNRILDSSGNLVFIYKTNQIDADDGEIGSYNDVYYCGSDSYFEPYDKQAVTEQELIQSVFKNKYTTKTIDDVLTKLVNAGLGTTEEIKNILKSSNPSVTDWSF
tara:strand:+ start:258 stop:629 length:372 start_codon:yes stop_codon:yes gene_type:complete